MTTDPTGPQHWHVTACVHQPLTDNQRDALFSAVADAAHDAEGQWIDGADVYVTGAPCHCLDTDPTAAPQPATPAQALRWAANRVDPGPPVDWCDSEDFEALQEGGSIARLLRRWADELDAAPAADPGAYQLPDEPDGPLWDPYGVRWERKRSGDLWYDTERRARPCSWLELLARGPLSTTPPAGTEGDDAD